LTSLTECCVVAIEVNAITFPGRPSRYGPWQALKDTL
jgi:hypothetical protein